ncbi:MAG: SH3 domain-containing protein [Bacillota bacterium]
MLKKKIFSTLSILLVALILLSIFPVNVIAQDRIGTITGSNVNVRKGPGTEYARTSQVTEGQFVSILTEKNNWYQVRLNDGSSGWIAGWLINEGNSSFETATVKGNILNVRKGPGTNYAVIGQAKAGAKLTILKSENSWYLVKLPDGKQGWVANWLVEVNRVAGAQIGIINGSAVNVRQNAGTTYPLLFKLNKGDQITIKDEKSGWYLIETSQGSGWIAAWLVNEPGAGETSRSAIITGSIVNVRREPSTQAPRLFQLREGDTVQIIGEQKDWYHVKTKNGQEGWVANWLISLESSPEPSGPITTAPSPTTPSVNTDNVLKSVIVTGSVVNIRQGPSLDFANVKKVTGGTELKVIGSEGEWLKVQLVDGTQGWIASWLTVDKDSQPLPLPNKYNNELKLTLDNERVLVFTNLGDKLGVTISGLKSGQYQIKRAEGNRLIIELNGLNLRDLVQPFDNWGIKEISIKGQAVAVNFDKDFKHAFKYNNTTSTLEMDITYPAEQLIPVKQIKLNPQENQSVVQIAAGKRIDYTTQELGPNRLAIDLPQSSLQLASVSEAEQNVAFGPIRKVTSRQLSPDVVRVEAELAPGTQYQVTQQDDYIVVGAKLAQGKLAGKTIVIDPGHGSVQPGGWTDPGAIGKVLKVMERDVNLNVALKLQQLLTQQGAKVIMTHTTGRTYLSLAGRADIANSYGADIFVSIHANSNENRAISGTSVYYYAPTWHSELASQRWLRQRLALSIQNELVKAGGRIDLGIMEESFAVIRETKVPSVLVEMAFLSNPEEERLLSTEQFRTQMAWGIFKGIERYFSGI